MSQASKMKHRHVNMESANPAVDLNPCLGKVRFESEEEAAKTMKDAIRAYFCPWCSGYHTSAHGFKGSRKGR